MRRFRWLTGLVLLLVAAGIIGLPGCSSPPSPWPAGKSPKVLTSFPPLYCFALNLVTEDAHVMSLLTTVGPHDYKVTPHDPIKVKEADLFLINGLGLDDTFTSRLKNSAGNVKLRFVEVSEAIPRAQLRKLSEAERLVEHDGHTHAHSAHDPHVWLGIPEAIHMVHRLRDELKKVDPARAAVYESRATDYIQKLEKLKAEGQALLATVKPEERQLITMHDSLYYFARTFGLNIVDSIQPRAGVELDAAQMAKLVELCKTKKIRAVTVEPQYPENAAKTLIAEVAKKGVAAPKIVVLDPLETADENELNRGWYETKMMQNLKTLADALR